MSNRTIVNNIYEIDNNIKYKLPNNWIELFDNNTKKYYYVYKITKHTQWLHPAIPIGTMMGNGLPYGWDIGYDKESKQVYYINHVGRFNTWNPPVKQRSYKGNDYIW